MKWYTHFKHQPQLRAVFKDLFLISSAYNCVYVLAGTGTDWHTHGQFVSAYSVTWSKSVNLCVISVFQILLHLLFPAFKSFKNIWE